MEWPIIRTFNENDVFLRTMLWTLSSLTVVPLDPPLPNDTFSIPIFLQQLIGFPSGATFASTDGEIKNSRHATPYIGSVSILTPVRLEDEVKVSVIVFVHRESTASVSTEKAPQVCIPHNAR